MNRAHYRVTHFRTRKVLAVVDLDDDPSAPSVTNDAERVVGDLVELFARDGLLDRRVMYRDSLGVWDELQHDGRRFTGFAPIRTVHCEDALERLGAR